MNVFDVHVNRSPIAGSVAGSHYVKGAFVNAIDKANIDNERLAILKTGHASVQKIGCVQIAGLVARRILCDEQHGCWPQARYMGLFVLAAGSISGYLPR